MQPFNAFVSLYFSLRDLPNWRAHRIVIKDSELNFHMKKELNIQKLFYAKSCWFMLESTESGELVSFFQKCRWQAPRTKV